MFRFPGSRAHHLDGVPGADGQLVGIRFLLWNMDADFAAHTALDIDLTPGLIALQGVVHADERDAIDGTDFQARFAARAIVGVDDRQLLRNFFAWSFFGHVGSRAKGRVSRARNPTRMIGRTDFVKSITILG